MRLKNYILLSITTLTLAGCTSEDITNTPNDERIPLRIEATLSGDRPVTRAEGSKFVDGDEIKCYIQHVYSDTKLDDATAYNKASQANLVSFKYGETTKFYWDDFSNASVANDNLLAENHGLRSVYGYCYNGGSPESEPAGEAGKLTWKIPTTQSDATTIKNNDLLWSPSQKPVKYSHGTSKEGEHGTLTIPFTHAMSKFTIVLIAGSGFNASDLDAANVTLLDMKTLGTFSAPDATVTASTTDKVSMFGKTRDENSNKRAYEALVVPTTSLAKDKHFANISIADNNYKVYISSNILTSWTAASLENDASKSGYNYKLTVTLNKQAVGVVASLAAWSDVSAEGNGEIQFDTDVTEIDKSNVAGLKSGDAFSLWMATDKDNMGSIATRSEFDGSKFVNSPAIYWPNGSDSYYFRALAKTSSDANKTMEAATLDDVDQGTDLLWGTTAAHTGKEADGTTTHYYKEGAAINPRTGEVPLVFKHVMSNVDITLTTGDDKDPSHVDLTNAKVTFTNLVNDGTIDIATGKIALGDVKVENDVKLSTEFSNLFMIPQTIGKDARLTITLDDGTTYSLQLNTCKDGSDTVIGAWESGSKYTYTISLAKEAIKFRVLVQDWDKKEGSGNAYLDWD